MQIYKVGGAVRDRLLGREVTEVDWVVVGATAEAMQAHGFRPVGADFPVFLHPTTGEEYALARTERKNGRGYGGFVFHASPDVTLEQDLIRRDLTINAMAEDAEGRLYDPYGGQRDLDARLLRHVSPAFAEDPLRVLRVARFAARYAPLGFRVAEETRALMADLAASGELQALTPERSWKEISRALMEPRPDVFIQVLRDCGALSELFPELNAQLARSASAAQQLLLTLRECALDQQPLPVRWACLLAMLDDTAIEGLNARSKAPRDCQELALLVGHFHDDASRAAELTSAELFELLQHFDIQRRPERFELFLQACVLLARGRGASFPQGDYLRGAAQAVRAVTVQPLIEQGYQGAELGEALKRTRLEAVARFSRARTECAASGRDA